MLLLLIQKLIIYMVVCKILMGTRFQIATVAGVGLVYSSKTHVTTSLRSCSEFLALFLGLHSDLTNAGNLGRRRFRIFKGTATFLAISGEHWRSLAAFHATIRFQSSTKRVGERDLRRFPGAARTKNRLRRDLHGRRREARSEANKELARAGSTAGVVAAVGAMGSISVHIAYFLSAVCVLGHGRTVQD